MPRAVYSLPRVATVSWLLIAMLWVGGCDGEHGMPGAAPTLVPLPVPAHLDELDPPVREQYEERRGVLDRLLAGAGSDRGPLSEAYGALGMWHQAYGDHELARLAYQHALGQNPETVRWRYYLGVVHGQLGETADARLELERFLEQRDDDAAARVHLAEIELDAGRTTEAEKLFRAALEHDADNPRALAGLGRLELQQRNFDAAAEHLRRALELQPERAKIHYSLGLAYRGLGERELAAEHMAEGATDNRDKADATMIDPLLAEVFELKRGSRTHGQRGRRAFVEGDFARAIEAARQAVEANPEAPQPRLNLGAALLRAGRPEEAVTELEEALELSPGHPIIHFNLAATFYQLGQLEAAEAQYLAAVTANPGFKEAWFNLANLRRFRGDFATALGDYQRVVELDPGLAIARLWRVVCLETTGRSVEARRALEGDLRDLSSAPLLRTLYIRLLANAGDRAVRDPAQALKLAGELYRVRPTLANAEALAAAHARQGDFARAVALQQAALEAIREQAGGKVLARVSERLEAYRRGETSDEVWSVDEHRGADLEVALPGERG